MNAFCYKGVFLLVLELLKTKVISYERRIFKKITWSRIWKIKINVPGTVKSGPEPKVNVKSKPDPDPDKIISGSTAQNKTTVTGRCRETRTVCRVAFP
jgi:hypothetical protein